MEREIKKPKRYLSFKEKEKRRAGKCVICGEPDYALLDCHRILPGEDGGKYTVKNTAVLCANCHRKSHAGRIVFEGKWFSTAARWVIFYTEDGVEKTA
jgi:hypothetical protein